jgi:hypothetical protein
MYNLTEKQKEVIHKALITASDNGTLDEFTNEELKLINRAESIVNKLTIHDVSGSLLEHKQVIRDLLDMYIVKVNKNGITKATITEALELTDRAVKLISDDR